MSDQDEFEQALVNTVNYSAGLIGALTRGINEQHLTPTDALLVALNAALSIAEKHMTADEAHAFFSAHMQNMLDAILSKNISH